MISRRGYILNKQYNEERLLPYAVLSFENRDGKRTAGSKKKQADDYSPDDLLRVCCDDHLWKH